VAGVTISEAVDLLLDGEMTIEGRMPYSSNGTYLVTIDTDDVRCGAIYKPMSGERPLWDFPPGLHKREVAAFALSEELGWQCVPPTVLRNGPHGEGSVQLFIDADFSEHHFTLVEEERHRPQLRQMCAFDVLANNTDRKSGHCLLAKDGHIWGIDHGLCFSSDFKLRTVIWEFSDEPLPEEMVASIERIATEIPDQLALLLSPEEADAVQERAAWLAHHGRFPRDDGGHRYPWPLV
jgi:uncharacterized repeat protein (TIGR03843 family)